MSTLRSGREIRAIVENARNLSSKIAQSDMLLDDNNNLVSANYMSGAFKT